MSYHQSASPTRRRFGGRPRICRYPRRLRFIVNECKDKGGNLYQMGVGGTASARGCGSSRYSSDHSIFKKEMLIWAHQQVMRLLKEDKTLTSYAELHRRFEEPYDLAVIAFGLKCCSSETKYNFAKCIATY